MYHPPPGAGKERETIRHYQDSFRLMDEYLSAKDLPPDSRVLTTSVMQDFARWLRDAPA